MKKPLYIFFLVQIFMFCTAAAQTFSPLSPAGNFTTSRNAFYSASIDSLAKDTAKTRKKIRWNSPGMVALQSALVPGLGQISNGGLHIIKVPVVYAGFAVCGYFINFNNKEYQTFRKAYTARINGDTTSYKEFKNYSTERLLFYRESYRQDRDLTIIITVGVYAANILDAYVFAHLKDFDVSENLALHVKPVTFSNIAGRNHITSGIQLKFK